MEVSGGDFGNKYQIVRKYYNNKYRVETFSDPREQYIGFKLNSELPNTKKFQDALHDCAHILKLIEYIYDPCYKYVIFESYEDYLHTYLIRKKEYNKETIGEEKARNWFEQILKGVQYMHSNKVLHLNIHSRTICIKDGNVKLAYSPSNKFLNNIDQQVLIDSEILPYKYTNQVRIGVNSHYDLWCAACVLYTSFTCEEPVIYDKHGNYEKPMLPDDVSKELKEIYDKIINDRSAKLDELLEKITKIKNSNNNLIGMELLDGRYMVLDKLGSGGYGNVFLVQEKYGSRFAMKAIQATNLSSSKTLGSIEEVNINRLLRKIPNANIAKYYDEFTDAKFDYFVFLIIEYCDQGDLKKYIYSNNKFPDMEKRTAQENEWIVQIMRGVNYLHSNYIIHSDIKPQNIFIKEKQIKIGDLGIAINLQEIEKNTKEKDNKEKDKKGGTINYVAPEIFESDKPCSYKSDVWSAGCVIYEIKEVKQAFNATTAYNYLKEIDHFMTENKLDDFRDSLLIDILKTMLVRDPEKRGNSEDILDQLEEKLKTTFYELEKSTKNKTVTVSLDGKIIQNYKILKVLDSGGYAKCFKVEDFRDNQIKAMKILNELSDSSDIEETEILKLVNTTRCPYVLKYYEAFTERFRCFIITELCEEGDLKTRIEQVKKEGKKIDDEILFEWCDEIIEALKFIKDKRIIHRDIKSKNIFLKKEKENKEIIKLGDFGISKNIKDTFTPNSFHTENGRMTIASSPPELVNGHKYGYFTDIWSAGCVFYELIALSLPFDSDNFLDLVKEIIENQPVKLDHKLFPLIEKMLVKDYKNRIQIEALQQEFNLLKPKPDETETEIKMDTS